MFLPCSRWAQHNQRPDTPRMKRTPRSARDHSTISASQGFQTTERHINHMANCAKQKVLQVPFTGPRRTM